MAKYTITKYIPHRCKYCRIIMNGEDRKKLYCSVWCKEEEELSKEVFHICDCGKQTGKYYYKKNYTTKGGKKKKVGQIAGYKKHCDECILKHGYK